VLRKRRFLIGGIIVFLVIGYLVFLGFQSSATYYYSVSEFMQPGNLTYGENVRVKGKVAPGSVVQEAVGRVIKFTIVEENKNLPVVYQGVVPDTFKVGADVVVEGQLDATGVFQATQVMPQCPSRYVPVPR